MSGRQYDRAKYIAANAPPDIIDDLDRGKRTIRSAYETARAGKKEKHGDPAPAAVKPAGRETDLDRAIRAEQELDAMKYRQHNEIYHRDSIIENLKKRVAELEEALAAADRRIKELENQYENGQT